MPDNPFPSLSNTEHALLRAMIREEVAAGVQIAVMNEVICPKPCTRVRLLLWAAGTTYGIGLTAIAAYLIQHYA